MQNCTLLTVQNLSEAEWTLQTLSESQIVEKVKVE